MQNQEFRLCSSITNIKEGVYLKLKDMIIKREFTPNEALYPSELAEQFGISRTPVRDALSMLESDGLVKTIPRKGTFVVGLYEKDIIEIYDARRMIELHSLQQGFAFLKENMQKLNEILEKMSVNPDNEINNLEADKGTQVANLAFHEFIVKSSKNDRIIDYYGNLTLLLGTTRAAYNYYPDSKRKKNAYKDHLMLVDFINRNNLSDAKELLSRHIEHTLHHLLETVQFLKVF